MKHSFIDKKAQKEILNQLEVRFMAGLEYMTVPELAMELFEPKHELAGVTAQTRTRSLLNSLKVRFKNKGIWFGCVDDEGHFGIMRDKSQGTYVVTRYYAYLKGMAMRASQASKEAHSKNLLPRIRNEILTIPSLTEE